MRRIICMMLLAMFLFSVIPACSWMGKQTGKATQTVKDAPGEFKQGYEEGKQEVKNN